MRRCRTTIIGLSFTAVVTVVTEDTDILDTDILVDITMDILHTLLLFIPQVTPGTLATDNYRMYQSIINSLMTSQPKDS